MNKYERILASLKTKYASYGLGDSVLEKVAKQIEPGVGEEDAQIETAVSGVGAMLKLFQTELDKGRNERTGLQKKLDEMAKAEEARKKAEEEARKKAGEEAKKAEEEARKRAEEEAAKGTPPAETPEDIFKRLFKAEVGTLEKSYTERVNKQAEEIRQLTERLQKQDEARAEAERLAGYKAKAAELGISKAYEPVIMAFASTAKDAQDFESRITSFKQSLIDDGSLSATPPQTAEQKQAQEGEEIAKLIDAGTKQIVEQRKN